MLQNYRDYVTQVWNVYQSAVDIQKGKFFTDQKILDALSAYKKTVEVWAKRGDDLATKKETTREQWNGWIAAGKVHESAFKEYGAYSPGTEIITAIFDTARTIPTTAAGDVSRAAKATGEVISAGATGLVSGASSGLLLIGAILVLLIVAKGKLVG